MQQVFVIADDLTGAAEIGGIAFLAGLSVRLIFNTDLIGSYSEDVIILDTNSRSFSTEKAYDTISDVLKKVDISEFKFFYKKIDSLLRGRVLPEIKALLDSTQLNSALIIPANPSKNRFIKSGDYYIGNMPLNETQFINDPEYPRIWSSVEELLYNGIEKSDEKRLYIKYFKEKIRTPDVSLLEDIHLETKQVNDTTILAGGADFFRSLLLHKLNAVSVLDYSSAGILKEVLFIIGSYSENSRNMRKFLINKNFKVHALPEKAILEYQSLENWEKQILRDRQKVKKLAITGPQKKLNNPEMLNGIVNIITLTAIKFLKDLPGNWNLFIEGGETASAYCRNMQWRDAVVSEVIGDGIITLGNRELSQSVTIKPGSYTWPVHLADMI
ncbi:MAG: four-carbon acid sugar kinase family protein [Bacteroidales bacterium]|nr:four-carbon acid sugar kinase family protein [Bacteroidales bacterium]MCF8391309.1 four-carbon acid sugar kinase family protein [Bacteroidales bacterium]